MRIIRLIGQLGIAAAVTVAAIDASAGVASACSCLPPTIESSYNQHSDVVRARVWLSLPLGSTTLYIARVQATYKGCLEAGEYIVLTTPSSSAACGIGLRNGASYLIQGEDAGTVLGLRGLAIRLCDYNKAWSALSDHDREFLAGRTVCCGEACTCADGTQPVNCFVDPCQVAPDCPDGECVANYCGGCFAEFYDEAGYAVCQDGCQSDDDCPADSWCRQAAPPDGNPGDAPEAMECVPFAQAGESCNGFTLPWFYERCEPELTCDTPDFVADASGVCRPSCEDDEGCTEGEYCASDGLCDDDGQCESDRDCNLPGNGYIHIACAGTGVCNQGFPSGQCGWQCTGALCEELGGEDFGACEAILGFGIVDGSCQAISGCDSGPYPLHDTLAACQRACEPECGTDADCMVTGCSSQVCAPEPVFTTCEFRPEYACYQDASITICGCDGGRCGWDQTDALLQCLQDNSGGDETRLQ